jgi:hypothetical protein
MKIHDFKTSTYFPWHVKLVGSALVIIAGSMLTMGMWIGGTLILLVSVIILTTHYRVRVDFDNKTYRDYLWILGMKSGDKKSFETIEYIFLKESRESQTMGLRAANTTIHTSVYDAYLKFSEAKKIHLITKNRKEDLIKIIRPIAHNQKTDIIDYTEGDPRVI